MVELTTGSQWRPADRPRLPDDRRAGRLQPRHAGAGGLPRFRADRLLSLDAAPPRSVLSCLEEGAMRLILALGLVVVAGAVGWFAGVGLGAGGPAGCCRSTGQRCARYRRHRLDRDRGPADPPRSPADPRHRRPGRDRNARRADRPHRSRRQPSPSAAPGAGGQPRCRTTAPGPVVDESALRYFARPATSAASMPRSPGSRRSIPTGCRPPTRRRRRSSSIRSSMPSGSSSPRASTPRCRSGIAERRAPRSPTG